MRKDNAVIRYTPKQFFGLLSIFFGLGFLGMTLRVGVALATGGSISDELRDETGESELWWFKVSFWITIACLALYLILPKRKPETEEKH